MAEINILYIHGFPKEDFEDFKELGFEVNIPEDKPIITALAGKPEDYLIVFSIYFSIKVLEKLIENSADGLSKRILKAVKKVWTKHKDIKPALIERSKNPIYKEPKAIVTFQISKDEKSKLEITNDLDDKKLKIAIKTYLKLVKLQYKNREKESILKEKLG
jgi:hypothetical protein